MVDTAFWTDPYVVTLPPDARLLFLYLLTNPLTNISGVYEITDRQIAFDTGFSLEVVVSALQRFEADGRLLRRGNWVALRNWIKHQSLSNDVRKGIARQIAAVPKELAEYVRGETVQDRLAPSDTVPTPSDTVPDAGTPNLTEPNSTELNRTERPPHMLLAESWYRAYSAKTVRLVAPGPDDYLKAETVCARMDPKDAESTIAPYFDKDWWFTRDKTSGRPAYSFGGWVAHIEEILAAGPVRERKPTAIPVRPPLTEEDLEARKAMRIGPRVGP